MTDDHYRIINRVIVLTEDDELREAARTSLHHIFGREKRLREFYESGNDKKADRAEIAKLREERDEAERRAQVNLEDANRGWSEVANLRIVLEGREDLIDEKDAELAKLRETERKLIGDTNFLGKRLAEAVARLEDADHHWREIHGVHTHEAML